MYQKLIKNGTAIAMIVGTVFIALFAIGIIAGEKSVDANGVESVEVDLGLQITILLTILAFLAMLVGVAKDILLSGKKGMRSFIGFTILLILFFILKATVTVEKGGKWDILYKEYGVSESASALVSAGLYTCGAILIISLLTFVYSEVRSFFN
jgi:hypothetical protein